MVVKIVAYNNCQLYVMDMRKLKLRKEDAQNRVTWRRGIYGKPSNLR